MSDKLDTIVEKVAKDVDVENIIDITGVKLSPGNPDECLGNGEHVDENGTPIECCCDECDHFTLCWREKEPEEIFTEIAQKLEKARRIIHNEGQNNV